MTDGESVVELLAHFKPKSALYFRFIFSVFLNGQREAKMERFRRFPSSFPGISSQTPLHIGHSFNTCPPTRRRVWTQGSQKHFWHWTHLRRARTPGWFRQATEPSGRGAGGGGSPNSRCGMATVATAASQTISTSPSRKASPVLSRDSRMGWSLMKVPLVDPQSRT